jgi:hypothetical protein
MKGMAGLGMIHGCVCVGGGGLGSNLTDTWHQGLCGFVRQWELLLPAQVGVARAIECGGWSWFSREINLQDEDE